MSTLDSAIELFIPELPICTWMMDKSLQVMRSAGGALKNSTKPLWDSPTLIQAAKQTLDGAAVSFSMDWEGFSYEVMLKPLENGVAGFALDVTERKILEIQRAQSQGALSLGRLVGGIAHDFNNLLTVTMNYTELLEDDLKGVPAAKKKIDAIANCTQRAVSLTSQLLTYSRSQTFKEQPIQLNMLLNSALHMLERVLGEDIELKVTLANKLGLVHADPYQLLHVVMTLAESARESITNSGTLSISTKQNNGHVSLVIEDTGRGFDKETLSQLFTPGEKNDMRFPAISGIIKALKGDIQVESKPGSGTKFTISFPTDEQPALTEPEKVTSLGTSSQTVLVVEDEEIVRQVTCDIIRSDGYNVIEATNALSALELCEQSPNIDLVLTDLVMPKMNGPEFIKKLSSKFPKIGVVFMSGYNSDAAFGKGLLQENASFIQKPFMPKALLKIVKDTLGGQSVTRES